MVPTAFVTPVPYVPFRLIGNQDILRCLDKLPPFSPVVRLLLASLSNDGDDVPLQKVASLVEQDTVIAGKVLGVVNSALYNRGTQICSVRQAVNRLGIGPLRNLVLGLSVNRIWSKIRVSDSFSMLRFNRHALATATLSGILAQHLPIPEPDGAFVAGLFHDVGQLVLIGLFGETYEELRRAVQLEGEELDELERESFGHTHGEISSIATGFWKLPRSVQAAVRLHERPLPSVQPRTGLTLAEVVHIADKSVTALGFSTIEVSVPEDGAQPDLSPLGLDNTKVCNEFLRQFNSLAQFS